MGGIAVAVGKRTTSKTRTLHAHRTAAIRIFNEPLKMTGERLMTTNERQGRRRRWERLFDEGEKQHDEYAERDADELNDDFPQARPFGEFGEQRRGGDVDETAGG